MLASLTNRIFLACALLAVLAIAAAVWVVNVQVTAEAEAELRRGLEDAGRLVDQHRATLFDSFLRTARLVADLPKLKAAVDLADPPTVQPLADDYRAQTGSALLVIAHRSGRVLARVGVDESAPGSLADPLALGEALAGREATAFWPTSQGILQLVTVPIVIGPGTPEILGTLTVGFALDDGLARRFKGVTDSEIAFAAGGRVQASTLPRAFSPELALHVDVEGVSRVRLGEEEYVLLARRLRPAGAARGDAASLGPVALILRSRTARLRVLSDLHRALALTALLVVALATLVSYGVARTVTRPLRALIGTMREMAATGDVTRPLTLPGPGRWQDEDARLLTSTFGTMTAAIARFQREAARRERLTSLGRLSTVIAHEIRNPLMIVKTAVRTLREGDVSPEEKQEGLSDIEAQVARLNRLVDDVLDFARPIRFEYAPADLNELCRRAADAATAGEPALETQLRLAPDLPALTTDAERLHGVLLNVLTNARHAALARADAAAGPSGAIELRTLKVQEGRVAVVVRDHGVGIAPDDLPRVFEPYFTTKRGGTGLGLAIAKNVVEGLGGTLALESRGGEGTEVRIELPTLPPEPAEARP